MPEPKKVEVDSSELAEIKAMMKTLATENAQLKAGSESSSEMKELLKMMAQREAKALIKDRLEEEARARKDKVRSAGAGQEEMRKKLSQAQCKHKKGRGGPRPGGVGPDMSVYLHTFIDGSQRCKCTICKMYWIPEDTKEFLYRDGKRVPNHTKIGWEECLAMLEQSTNKASSSEIPIQGKPHPGSVAQPPKPVEGIVDVGAPSNVSF